MTAKTDFDWLILSTETGTGRPEEFLYSVGLPGTISVGETGQTVSFKIVGAEQAFQGYNNLQWPKLDPLKLPARLVFRNWRQGDRYRPVGFQKSVKLKELFRRHRVPVDQRALWPVVDSENGIVCARGLPAAAWAAANKESHQILLILESPTR